MLVLTRKEQEKVIIYTSDGDIEITINRIDGNQVRLGFDAPENVDIEREELIKD
jgi:carbon storage regulator